MRPQFAEMYARAVPAKDAPLQSFVTGNNAVQQGKPKDKKEVFLSHSLARLNELFITDNLTDKDMINYALTVRDKLSKN